MNEWPNNNIIETKQTLAIELAVERYSADYEIASHGGCGSSFKNQVKMEDYLEDAMKFINRCADAK